MKSIPGDLLQELGQVATTSPWVELLAIDLPHGKVLRVANNTENVTYDGNVYVASSYEPEIVEQTTDARMPSYTLRLSHIDRRLLQWLRAAGGLEGYTITAVLINTNDLTADYSEFTTTYDISNHSDDDETVEFEIGGPNLYRWRHPFGRYMPDLCEHAFKGVLCGYSGPEASCTYRLSDCRDQKNNAARFGGTPGLNPKSLRVV